ncbi:MAG: N-acyl amino acid synthase of PEP-CTERM/exosortase system, partial [Halioglobus sp.]
MMPKKTTSIVEDFQEYFNVELATTPEQMAMVYRIRYRVYCEEFGYEEAESFPLGQESDEFDAHSVHCLIVHKLSGMPAACVRVVKADQSTKMPMEKYCQDSLDSELFAELSAQRSSVCEFSRLAVDGAFRRRSGERASRFGEISSMDCTKRELRTFSLIAIAAFVSGFAVCDHIGRQNAFAMMEPFLPRLLLRSGVAVKQVGVPVDYHGMRAPYFATTQTAVAGMPPELLELYDTIHRKFAVDLSVSKDLPLTGVGKKAA